MCCCGICSAFLLLLLLPPAGAAAGAAGVDPAPLLLLLVVLLVVAVLLLLSLQGPCPACCAAEYVTVLQRSFCCAAQRLGSLCLYWLQLLSPLHFSSCRHRLPNSIEASADVSLLY